MLEDVDGNWSRTEQRNSISYARLPQGIYKLHLRTTDGLGNYSSETILEFEIAAPWYRTYWWFFTCSILIVCVLYITYFLMKRRLQMKHMYQPVSGVYAKIRTSGLHWVIWEITTIRDQDVFSGQFNGSDYYKLSEYKYNDSFWGFNELWMQYYNIIKTANAAIESLDLYAQNITNDSDTKNYKAYRGEVMFMLLDYVFVTSKVKVDRYRVVQDTPDNGFLSDHCPVFVNLTIE